MAPSKVPRIIAARLQNIFPLFLVMFVYLGFFASSGLLAAQTLSSLTSIDQTWSILLLNVLCFIATIYGYNLIHKMQKLLSWTSFFIYLVATFIVFQLPLPSGSWTMGNLDLPVFLLAVSMVATWQLAYAPYVADYSRYLPVTTPASQTFWYSYAGTSIGTIWMMILGATLTIAIPNFLDHSGGNLAHLFGSFAIIMFFIIIFEQLAINVFNLYGAFMATITTIEPFIQLKVTPKVRIGMIFCVTAVGTGLCLLGQSNFLAFFLNFIFFISYF